MRQNPALHYLACMKPWNPIAHEFVQPCHCPPDWTWPGLRTNRVKQMAKLNEICYEAVIEQVRKGHQPLSCFWSCYLADTHEQPSSTFVKRNHIEAEAKKVHIRNSSLPWSISKPLIVQTLCFNLHLTSCVHSVVTCEQLWTATQLLLRFRHLFDSSATLSFDNAGHQVMVFVHSRGDTFKTVPCSHLFIRFNSAESPERMNSEAFSEYIWPDLTGICFFFTSSWLVLYMVKVFAAHLHRLTQES